MNRRRKKSSNRKRAIFIVAIFLIVLFFLLKGKKDTSNNKRVDKFAPNISLNGLIHEKVVIGDEYIEQGAKAEDDVDGDLSSKLKIDGVVDTSKAGVYELKYSVSDFAGNVAEVKREVTVCNALSEAGLPVLMYHFFYDKNKTKGQDGNWIEISNFEEQIKYLSENNFYFPSWQEVEDYIDGKKNLPEKSIVITVDDGDPSFFELAVPIIQKYKAKATSFVIAYWYGERAENKQDYIDYQSHSYDMHKAGEKGRGVMLSWSYEKIKEDLELSSQVLGGANIFCYPFGQYNETDKKALKGAGYNLAFTTQGRKSKKRSLKI